MNRLSILKESGGVPRSLAGEDHVSGFLMYFGSGGDLPDGFSTGENIHAVSTLESAEGLGILGDSENWYCRALHYHLSECFRINPGISLYVGLYAAPAVNYGFSEVKTLQNYTGGKIRQMAVYAPDKNLSSGDLTSLQGVAKGLENDCMPLSLLYGCTVSGLSDLTNMSAVGQSNVSVVVSQDGDPAGVGFRLYEESGLGLEVSGVSGLEVSGLRSVTTIGLALGTVSLASVHESISWVKKFPSGIFTPALACGDLIRELDKAVIEDLDGKRYLFLLTYPGMSGSFWNDSHTMDLGISDYAYIENVRTIDKAVRGVRTYLLPELSGPLYVDPASGNLSPGAVTYLEQIAGRTLEDMERAGELSGYRVEINPEQNVLATSEVEVVIKKVGVGVMRKVKVRIGFVTQL